MKNPTMTIHKAGQGYIGRLRVSKEFITSCSHTKAGKKCLSVKPQTVFILDRSGSMGSNVARMAQGVIPGLARKYFGLESNDQITLIMFDCHSQVINSTVRSLESSSMHCGGSTRMSGVFEALIQSIDKSNPFIRIVAISDGQIQDTEQTLSQAASAAEFLKKSYSISVTAVRLFTSYSQPDTRALASVLRLNTSKPGSIVDVQANSPIEDIVKKIGSSASFSSSSGPSYSIQADHACLMNVPWAVPVSSIHIGALVANKPETLWFSTPPTDLSINKTSLDIVTGESVTHDTLSILLQDKIDFFTSQIRVLKVLGSESASQELERIVGYFESLERSLPPPEDLASLLEDGSLAGRSKYLKASLERQVRSVTNVIKTMANDERVTRLNMAQQADYLRQAGTTSSKTSRTTRALARRAEASGISFDDVVRSEIIAMASHMKELTDVDDSGHAVSFYSQATTMDGIRFLVQLSEDSVLLNSLPSAQLLQLFNVVGIPAVGPVGDFPDPMTYRLEKIVYGGVFVSVADIITVLDQGGTLEAPGSNREPIITAIPIYEDPRVQKFLQKYARSSLEYISSIGMRRMIADVPKTYPYTICAGLWKMVEELDKEKSEIRIKHFEKLVSTYEHAILGLFEHIIPLVENDPDPSKSLYLGHNGITNLIAPILHLVRTRNVSLMPRILRALYSFETYQIMRRLMRDGGPESRQSALDKLLGVDFSSGRQTSLPPKFTRTTPVHCSTAVINQEEFTTFKNALWFVHYATLLAPLFKALIYPEDGDRIKSVRMVPCLSETTISNSLGLDGSVPLDDFLLYNVVEGLMYGNKQARIDKDTDKPKLGDLGHAGVGAKMVQTYVSLRYKADYEARLKMQLGEEEREIRRQLISELCSADTVPAFAELLVNGKKRGEIEVKINRSDSIGFKALHDRLMGDGSLPKRLGKIRVIYTGRTSCGESVFNGGNVYRADWKPLKEILLSSGHKKLWLRLREELTSRGFQYRGGRERPNRHGHSNDLMSYFAFGCNSLEEYHKVASESEWKKYIKDHRCCCGVSEYLAKIEAAGI